MVYDYKNIYIKYQDLLCVVYFVGHGVMEFNQLFDIMKLKYPNQLNRQIRKLQQYNLVDIFNIDKVRFIKLKAKGVLIITNQKSFESIRVSSRLIKKSLISCAIFQRIMSQPSNSYLTINEVMRKEMSENTYMKGVSVNSAFLKQIKDYYGRNCTMNGIIDILKNNDSFNIAGIVPIKGLKYLCLSITLATTQLNQYYLKNRIVQHITDIISILFPVCKKENHVNLKFAVRFYVADYLAESIKPLLQNMVSDIRCINGCEVLYICNEIKLQKYMHILT